MVWSWPVSSAVPRAARLEPPRAIHILIVALVGILAVTYWETVLLLVGRWNSDPNYSHGFLVPLVSFYLLRRNGSDTEADVSGRGGVFVGVTLISLGALSRGCTVLVPSLFLECLSLLVTLWGLAWLLGGRRWGRRSAAPIAFLLFMVPWPSAGYSRMAFPLQLLVSQAAAATLEELGIPILRDGNLLRLPGQTMHVAEACSGLRQLVAFLAIGTCAAILLPRPAWYRLTVFCSAIPIAIFINILRVVGTGYIAQLGYAEWTSGAFHVAEGLIMVGMGLALMAAEIRVLDWLVFTGPSPGSSESLPPNSEPSSAAGRQGWSWARLAVAASLLGFGLMGQSALAERVGAMRQQEECDLVQPLAAFPRQIGAWSSEELPPDPAVIRDIKIDGYLQRTYSHPSGERVVLWMSFSKHSSDQYHYPTVCMRGTGWTEQESARGQLEGENAAIARLWFTRAGQTQVVFYWYYLIGEDPVDRLLRRFSQAARGFLRGRRNASLTVEIFSQSDAPDAALLDELAGEVARRLTPFLPQGSESACDLGASY